MLEEYDHSLAQQCDDAVQELYDAIITEMEDYFDARPVPEDYDKCDSYLYYMAETFAALGGGDLTEHPLFKESHDWIVKRVDGFTTADLFACRCFHIENEGSECDEETIITDLLDAWCNNLYDFKISFEQEGLMLGVLAHQQKKSIKS